MVDKTIDIVGLAEGAHQLDVLANELSAATKSYLAAAKEYDKAAGIKAGRLSHMTITLTGYQEGSRSANNWSIGLSAPERAEQIDTLLDILRKRCSFWHDEIQRIKGQL